MKKKILICTFEYPPVGSGIANVAYNLRNEFSKENKVDVCSPVGPEIRIGSWPLIEKTGGLGIIYYWWKTGRFLKKNIDKYDAILLENPLLLHKIYSPKIKITTHTTYTEYHDQVKESCGFVLLMYYKFMRAFEKWSFNRLDKRIKFTSASDCVTEEIEKLKIPSKNIIYISNGAKIDRFKPVSLDEKLRLRKKYRISNDKLTFLFVGRLEYQHQPIDLIKIFYGIKKEVPNSQLVIVGKGSLEKETKKTIENLNVDDVIIIPRIEYEKVHEIFQASEFFILNSLYTGQSLAMLEAVAAGCPLIVPDITEFRRIVKDSKSGILYAPQNTKKAIKQITDYLRKVDVENEKKTIREYAERKVSWKEISKEYFNYFFKK